MVNDLHDLFGSAGIQAVVDAGHGINTDHGGAVDGSAQNVAPAAHPADSQNAEDAADDRKTSTCNVGHHVHDFLTLGIAGKKPVF